MRMDSLKDKRVWFLTLPSLAILLIGLLSPRCRASSLPEWVMDVPPGYETEFVLAIGYSHGDAQTARQNALEDGIRKIAERKGMRIDASAFTSEQVDAITHIRTSLAFRTPGTDLGSLRLEEEALVEQAPAEFTAYLLMGIPRQGPRSAPSVYAAVARSLAVPGWGHRALGRNRAGTHLLCLSVAMLAGSALSWIASDAYHSHAATGRTADAIRFGNTQSGLWRKSAIGFTLAYGILGGYASVDIIGSKYLSQYL
jgi:hypothetical protein